MADKKSDKKNPQLTTAAGIPVGDNQNSITAGPRGAREGIGRFWDLYHHQRHL
jgi:catalase